MKFFFKIIYVLFINILLIFIICEFLCWLKLATNKAELNVDNYHNLNICEKIKVISQYKYSWYKVKSFEQVYNMIKKDKFRQPEGLIYNARPILLLGCSFAYGFELEKDENLGYKLSKILKRPVYNRAFMWFWGLQTMLYQSRREDFYKEIPNPEYIIYIFIDDQIPRICRSISYDFSPIPYIHYNYHNSRLEREKFDFKYNLFLFKVLTLYKQKRILSNFDFNLVNEYFKETKQEFDKHWENYKFIILVYQGREQTYNAAEKVNWKELEDNGFTVIKTKDLVGRDLDRNEDVISDGFHPNGEVWSIIANKLSTILK